MQQRQLLEESLDALPDFWQRVLVLPGHKTLRLARRKPLGAVSAAVIIVIVLMAVFADATAPYGATDVQVGPSMVGPSGSHIFGADQTGRDMFSRIMFGARISLWVGIVAVTIGVGSGTVVGLLSGYFGGKMVDTMLQRVMDTIMAFPALILVMAIVSVLGPSTTNAMLAIEVVIMPGISRVVRGAVLTIKQNQFVEAAQLIGCSAGRVMVRHILPNVAAPIIILATLQLGNAILAEAA